MPGFSIAFLRAYMSRRIASICVQICYRMGLRASIGARECCNGTLDVGRNTAEVSRR